MDSYATTGTISSALVADEAVTRAPVKELLLTAIFVIHAAFFASLYIRRGRHGFYLLFVCGFLLLAVFYASSGLLSLGSVEPAPRYLFLFRWTGLILCALATPPFLIHWYRRRRGDPARL